MKQEIQRLLDSEGVLPAGFEDNLGRVVDQGLKEIDKAQGEELTRHRTRITDLEKIIAEAGLATSEAAGGTLEKAQDTEGNEVKMPESDATGTDNSDVATDDDGNVLTTAEALEGAEGYTDSPIDPVDPDRVTDAGHSLDKEDFDPDPSESDLRSA
jgi:hypothetical protein